MALFPACSDDGGGDTGGEDGNGSHEWTFYGRDYENTRSNTAERKLSPKTVGQLEKKWEWSGKMVTSTPMIRDGIVYFGTWGEELVALDAVAGTEVWKTSTQLRDAPQQFNHTPAVTEDRIYAACGVLTAELWAFNRADGSKLWDKPLELEPQPLTVPWSSPVLVDDLLVMGVGSSQVFFNVGAPFKGSIVGVDVNTGQKRWQTYVTDVQGVSVWSTAAIDKARGLLYIGTGQPYLKTPPSPMADGVVALRYATGEIAWSRQFTADDWFQLGVHDVQGPDHDVGASPNLFKIGDRDVVGVGDKEGSYYALDRDTGEEVWKRKLSPGGANGGVMATAAYHDGVIYVASNDGTSGGAAGGGLGPARGTIFALDASNGESLWETETEPATFGALTYANGVVYVPTIRGVMLALEAETGNELWQTKVGNSLGGGVSVSDGMLYVPHGWGWLVPGGGEGGVVAYGLPGGK